MTDAVILLAVVVLLVFSLKNSLKHFRGEGACCKGGRNPSEGGKRKKRPAVK